MNFLQLLYGFRELALNWKFYRVYDEDVSLKMKVLTNNAEKF